MRKLLFLILPFVSVWSFGQQSDATTKSNTDSQIRNAALGGVTRAIVSSMADALTDSKVNRSETLLTTGTNDYTITPGWTPDYSKFPQFKVKFVNGNTGAVTVNTIAVKKNVSSALSSGDIAAGAIYDIVYDGTNFQITLPGSGGGGVAWGGITGTLSSQTDLQSALTALQPQLNGTGFIKATGTTISYDNSTYLTANQSITVSGAVTGSGTTTITTTLATPGTLTVSSTNSNVTAHTHAITSSSSPGAAASLLSTDASGIIGSTGTRIIKGWFTDLTVTNAIAGSVTGNAATVTTNANLTGDLTSSGNATTLATVNSNVGSFASATQVGTFTVNGKGLITAAGNTTITPAVGSITGLASNVATFLATPSSSNLISALTDETGTGAAVFGTTPTITTPVINGLATGTGVSSAATASTIVTRDANANISANNSLLGYTTTTTAAGTTTLTVASSRNQYFTGSTTQTLVLPVTSTLSLGFTFNIVNNSTGAVTVQSSGANTIQVMSANSSMEVKVILTSGTTGSSWSYNYYPSNPMTTTGDIIYATSTGEPAKLGIGSTNGLLTVVGGIPAWRNLIILGAGTPTASTAPLKFTSGTNLTTPEAGAVEFDGTNYFGTASTTRYTFAKTLTATATLDFGSTTAGNATDLTITVTGAADGDAVSIGVPNGSTLSDGAFTAWVSATNTVTIRFINNNLVTALDPASGTFRASVIKY